MKKKCCKFHNKLWMLEGFEDFDICGAAGRGDKPTVCCRNCPDIYHSNNHYAIEEGKEIVPKYGVKERRKVKVGDRIKEWVVARVWEWPKWYDLELVKDGGECGELRVAKKEKRRNEN